MSFSGMYELSVRFYRKTKPVVFPLLLLAAGLLATLMFVLRERLILNEIKWDNNLQSYQRQAETKIENVQKDVKRVSQSVGKVQQDVTAMDKKFDEKMDRTGLMILDLWKAMPVSKRNSDIR